MPIPRCPECGLEQPSHVPLLAPMRKWVRRSLWTLALLFSIAYVVAGYEANLFTSGEASPRFPEPISHINDVAALAEGKAASSNSPGTFHRSILDLSKPMTPGQPGDTKLYAAFGAGPSIRSQSVDWGFPFSVLRRESFAAYEDALSRKGFKPSVTDPTRPLLGQWEYPNGLPSAPPRTVWSWTPHQGHMLIYQPPPESTDGVLKTWLLRISGIALQAAMLAILTSIFVVAWKRTRRHKDRTGGAIRWLVAFAIALIFQISVSIATAKEQSWIAPPDWSTMRQVNFPPAPVYWARDEFRDIGMTRNELLAIEDQPDADKVLAQRILAAVPPEKRGTHLAIWPISEARVAPTHTPPLLKNMWSTPLGGLYRYSFSRHPLFGESVPIPATSDLSIKHNNGTLWVRQSRNGDLWVLQASTTSLLALIVTVIALCWGFMTLVRFLKGVRPHRRFTRTCCVRCGYSLV